MKEVPREIPANQEAESHPGTAWLFDIDGVVTNPDTATLQKPQIIDFMVERLSQDEPVALVTGRALNWVRKYVLPTVLEKTHSNPLLLNNFYVSGEFGGSFIHWQDGVEQDETDANIKVPQELADEVKNAAGEYKSTHFIDPDKETMVSLEKLRGMNVEDFKPAQYELAEKLNTIVSALDPNGQFEVHVDRIATNVRDKRANKYYAAEQVVNWLKQSGRKFPGEFITFGDSTSDSEMSKQLSKMGINTRLIFVGGRKHLEGMEFNFPVEFTEGHCDEGVVEFIDKYHEGLSA